MSSPVVNNEIFFGQPIGKMSRQEYQNIMIRLKFGIKILITLDKPEKPQKTMCLKGDLPGGFIDRQDVRMSMIVIDF